MNKTSEPKPTLGWREIIILPDFSPLGIAAKIDTGAKTSALNASAIETYVKGGALRARFTLEPKGDGWPPIECDAPCVDKRFITSSTGEVQERYIIEAQVLVGSSHFTTEFSLSERHDMKFAILIGRRALKNRFIVDSGKSFLQKPV